MNTEKPSPHAATLLPYMSAQAQGMVATQVAAVQVFWSRCALEAHVQDYPFGLVFIFQGRKKGYLGERQFSYGAGDYLAVGLPIHFVCEAYVDDDAPLLGIFVHLDAADLSRLAARMIAAQALPPPSDHVGVEPLPITAPMDAVLARLLTVLHEPQAGAILGPLYVRELCFHVLQQENSAVLLSHLNRATPKQRVAQTVAYLHTQMQQPPSTAELAQRAHMSVASFNRHFRAFTGNSVAQYSKTMRLMRARHLLTVEGQNVQQTAEQIGYGSTAQFSRDFKAFFGVPPKLALRLSGGTL
jgi:AraC-like DNA-binding protein